MAIWCLLDGAAIIVRRTRALELVNEIDRGGVSLEAATASASSPKLQNTGDFTAFGKRMQLISGSPFTGQLLPLNSACGILFIDS